MKVSLQLKNNTVCIKIINVTRAEKARLIQDFESYSLSGLPESGVYTYYYDPDHKIKRDLRLNFRNINAIK